MITDKSSNEAQGNSINPLLPAVAVLAIRNMKSKLPDDFGMLLSIELKRKPKTFLRRNKDGKRQRVKWDNNLPLLNMNPMEQMKFTHNAFADNRMFCIRENEIYFTGSYSKNVFVRWVQKLKEKFFPEKAILKYVDMQTLIESDDKLRMKYERWQSHCG